MTASGIQDLFYKKSFSCLPEETSAADRGPSISQNHHACHNVDHCLSKPRWFWPRPLNTQHLRCITALLFASPVFVISNTLYVLKQFSLNILSVFLDGVLTLTFLICACVRACAYGDSGCRTVLTPTAVV